MTEIYFNESTIIDESQKTLFVTHTTNKKRVKKMSYKECYYG